MRPSLPTLGALSFHALTCNLVNLPTLSTPYKYLGSAPETWFAVSWKLRDRVGRSLILTCHKVTEDVRGGLAAPVTSSSVLLSILP